MLVRTSWLLQIFDVDNDGVLNDKELNNFQVNKLCISLKY